MWLKHAVPLLALATLGGCMMHRGAGPDSEADWKLAKETSAKDLGNTVCPISGDKVEDSRVVVLYAGTLYHFCCDDCRQDFKLNPDKYVKMMAADPAKYGIK
jgi:YHS domain-containing protein